jgi:hypothetical protein
MSDTRCQNECEGWIRNVELAERFGCVFTERNVPLQSGGQFKFDAVNDDSSIIVSISTSKAAMSSGKKGVGKLMKLRSDMLFHMLAPPARHIMLFTEPCMYEQIRAESERGRVPTHIEFLRAELPSDLAARLATSRDRSSREVRPPRQPATQATSADPRTGVGKKRSGVIAAIKAMLDTPSGATRSEILDELVTVHPDRDPDGMAVTVGIQVSRLAKSTGRPIVSFDVEGRGKVYGFADVVHQPLPAAT